MELRYGLNTKNDLGFICARVIAAIGIFHSFVNDPIQLKATNQQTLKNQRIQDLEEVKSEG